MLTIPSLTKITPLNIIEEHFISDYYCIDKFNSHCKPEIPQLSIYHMNIRRLAPNRGKLIALLSTLNIQFDIIVLTEVGDDADRYLSNETFQNYEIFHSLPIKNRYGGTAILIKKN